MMMHVRLLMNGNRISCGFDNLSAMRKMERLEKAQEFIQVLFKSSTLCSSSLLALPCRRVSAVHLACQLNRGSGCCGSHRELKAGASHEKLKLDFKLRGRRSIVSNTKLFIVQNSPSITQSKSINLKIKAIKLAPLSNQFSDPQLYCLQEVVQEPIGRLAFNSPTCYQVFLFNYFYKKVVVEWKPTKRQLMIIEDEQLSQ